METTTLIQAEYLKPGMTLVGSLTNMIVERVKVYEIHGLVAVAMHHPEDESIKSQRQFAVGSTLKVVI